MDFQDFVTDVVFGSGRLLTLSNIIFIVTVSVTFIVRLTPTTIDDSIWSKVIKILQWCPSFGVNPLSKKTQFVTVVPVKPKENRQTKRLQNLYGNKKKRKGRKSPKYKR